MLFQPTNITPSTFAGVAGGTIAAADPINITWQINGNDALTALRIQISLNDAASTSVHDTGIVNVSPAFYGTDQRGNPTFYSYVPGDTWSAWGITDGNDYKLKITQYWGGATDAAHSVSQYSDSAFISRTAPTLTLGTVSTPVNTVTQAFTAVYSQAQGDSIAWIRWQFGEITSGDISALSDDNVRIIDDTGYINTGMLAYTADGMITGNQYAIKATAASANGVEVTTGWFGFDVSYVEAAATGDLSAELYPNGEGVLLTWAASDDIPGVASEDAQYTMNNGKLQLEDGGITWDTVNSEAMSFNSPFTAAWRGNVSQVYKSLGSLSSEGSINVILNCGNILVVGGNIPGAVLYFDLNGTTATFGGYLKHNGDPFDGAIRCATMLDSNTLFIGGEFSGYGCVFDISGDTPIYKSDVASLDGPVNYAEMWQGDTLYLGGAFSGYVARYTYSNGTLALLSTATGTLASFVTSEVYFAHPIISPDSRLFGGGVAISSANGIIVGDLALTTQAYPYIKMPNAENFTDAISIADLDNNGRLVIGTLSHGVIAAYWDNIGDSVMYSKYISNVTDPVYCVKQLPNNQIFVGGTSAKVFNYTIDRQTFTLDIDFNLAGTIQGAVNCYGADLLSSDVLAIANSESVDSVILTTSYEEPDTEEIITEFVGNITSTIFAITAEAIAANGDTYVRATPSLDAAEIVSNNTPTSLARNNAPLGGRCLCLDVNANGDLLVVGGDFDGYGALYSISNGTATYLADLDRLDSAISIAKFSNDGSMLVVGNDTEARLYSIANNSATYITNVNVGFDFIVFTPDDNYLIGGQGSLLSVYSTATGALVSTATVSGANKLCGTFDKSGAYLVVGFDTAPYGGYFGFIGGQLNYMGSLGNLNSAVTSVAFNSDGTLLAAIGANYINIYNLNNGAITYGGSPFAPTTEIYNIVFGDTTDAYISAKGGTLLPVFSTSATLGTLLILAGFTIETTETGIQIKNGGNLLASYYIPTGAQTAIVWIYVGDNGRVGATFYNGSTRTSVSSPISVQQANISSIVLTAPQTADWVYVAGGYYNISANNYTPSWNTANTYFYADFVSSLQGGTTDVPGYYNDIYRLKDGDANAVKVGHVPTGVRQMIDFGARSSETYDYELFYNSAANAYSVPAIVNDICFASRKYMLYEATQDAEDPNVYQVLRYFAFQGNIAAGAVTNGNSPTWLNNFTKYRLRQPSSIMGKSGTLQALLGLTINGQYYDSYTMQEQLFEASASKNTFFLKDTKGNLYNVHISQPISQTIDTATLQKQVTVSVPWEEVGDASNVALVQYPTDEGWISNGVLSARLNVNSSTGRLSAYYPSQYNGTTFGMRGNVLTASTPAGMEHPDITLTDGMVTATLSE